MLTEIVMPSLRGFGEQRRLEDAKKRYVVSSRLFGLRGFAQTHWRALRASLPNGILRLYGLPELRP
jgi:hypothetical protein